jgi:hypothetical protein
MNTAKKEPVWIGYDAAKSDHSVTLFIFICDNCGRHHNATTTAIPDGWDKVETPGIAETIIHCPDCLERVEQTKISELRTKLESSTFSGLTDSAWATKAAFANTLVKPLHNAFTVVLEKRDGGDYRIAMLPEAAMMRWLPLGFFLTPSEARATAKQLVKYAELAEAPGTLPASIGEGA